MILNIHSFKCYDSLFMSIPIKWHNEITRFLKVEITIHEYFKTIVKVKNISLSLIDLELEIGESNYLEENQNKIEHIIDYKQKR